MERNYFEDIIFEKKIFRIPRFKQENMKTGLSGMRDIKFKDCSLHEVDFTEKDGNNAIFDACDLFYGKYIRLNG